MHVTTKYRARITKKGFQTSFNALFRSTINYDTEDTYHQQIKLSVKKRKENQTYPFPFILRLAKLERKTHKKKSIGCLFSDRQNGEISCWGSKLKMRSTPQ